MKKSTEKLVRVQSLLFIAIVVVVIGLIGWQLVPATTKCSLRHHANQYQKDLCMFSAQMKDMK